MRQSVFIIVTGLLLSLSSCAKSERADIAIRNVTIIDATGASARSGMTVLIAGNRILRINKARRTKLSKEVRVVDGSGKFLIPGLWDAHIHPFEGKDIRWKEFMALFLANGITSVRVMFGDPKFHQWREEVMSNRLAGPRMLIASPRPPDMSTEDQGRQFVRKSKGEAADFIKILSDGLPRDVYFAVADEAKKQGIPFVGHVPYSLSAIEASDAGQLSFEHKYAVTIPCSELEELIKSHLAKIDNFRERVKALAEIGYDQQKATSFFRRLIENGTYVCPTLVVWNDAAYLDKTELANDPRLAYFPSELRNWHKTMGERIIDDDVVANLRRICLGSHDLVDEMNRAGVKILAGTDSGSVPFLFQGFSLHDELRLLVESGLSPMEALQTATMNAAACAGRLDSLGTIEEGKIADLVLLDDNPVSSIANTRKIRSVFFDGQYLDRSKLDLIQNRLKKLAAEM